MGNLIYFSIVNCAVSEPKMIVIDHDYSKRPLQLFWMDGLALQAISGQTSEESTLLTEITTEDTNDNDKLHFPKRPALESLAGFKTTPAIHVGYAVTWYGLSVAGIYMTRKLITRGRG
jgi:surfeit locus 1 family protein